MDFLDLFVVAFIPVLKILLVTAIGLFLARERVNLLGPEARHHLNNLVFYVFCPALVVSSLADTITASNIVSLWFMPVNILLAYVIGSALGWVLVKITRTPKHLYGLVIGCCSAGNVGGLLLIIIPAVCEEKDNPFGDSYTCSTNGGTYASLSMAIGAVYIWSYVYNIFRASVDKSDSRNGVNSHGEDSDSCKQALLSSKDCQSYEDHEALVELAPIGSDYNVSIFVKIKQQVKIFAEKINLKMLFAPTTIATIVGLLIGVITPIRKIMVGENAPLRALDNSASLLGEATIPAMTLIVGANLLRGLRKSGVDMWVVMGVMVVRYVALPLLGIAVVKAAGSFGWVGSDSLYEFVLLLQYAVPPAMAVGTIAQLFEVGESECSVLMLWNYALASLFVTLWSAYYMWLVS